MKVWEKAKAFYKEHKVAIVAIVTSVGGVVSGALLHKHFAKQQSIEPVKETLELPKSEEDDWSWADPMLQTIVHYEKEAEKGNNHWYECEHQRENWNKLVEFAKDIQPGDGEYFVIEGTNPDCNKDHVEWFVHHWQYEWPSYPTEMITEEVKGE